MEGILKVINMLGLTINDLQVQIEQQQTIIQNQQAQIDQLKELKTGTEKSLVILDAGSTREK